MRIFINEKEKLKMWSLKLVSIVNSLYNKLQTDYKFLPNFLKRFNERFSVKPKKSKTAFVKLPKGTNVFYFLYILYFLCKRLSKDCQSTSCGIKRKTVK